MNKRIWIQSKKHTVKWISLILVMMISLSTFSTGIFSSTISFANDFPTSWSLENIFESDEAFKTALETFQNQDMDKLKAFKGKLSDDATLLECLKHYEALNIMASKLYVYAAMMQDTDTTNSLYLENKSLSLSAVSSLEEAASFLVPEILERSDDEINALIDNPKFQNFGNYLNSLVESRDYYFDENSERILALATPLMDMPYEIYTQLTVSDAQYGSFTNHMGETQTFDPEWDTIYWYASDEDMRDKALSSYYSPYIENANTLASIYIAELQKNAFAAKSRGYESSLAAALDGAIEPEQYKAMIDVTRANAPLLKRYFELRKNALGFDKLSMSDMHLAYTTEYYENYDYEKGVSMVLDALKPLGQDYQTRLEDFIQSGSIDVYPNTYKTTSQYSWGAYDSPVYVLLNYQDSFEDVSTLAHELGHAMHQTLIQENQPYFDASVPSFPAEVTSTLNELFLADYIQNNSDDAEAQLLYTTNELDNIYYIFFEQVILADFEMQAHEIIDRGEALSLESLNQLWLDTVIVYYGDAVELPDYYAYYWMTVPHMFQNHYVYSYAMSFAAAQKIKDNIDAHGDSEIQAYLDFLTRGGSEMPTDSLERIGIVFSDNHLYDAVFNRMDALITEVEQQLDEIGDERTYPPNLLDNDEIESILGSWDRPESPDTDESSDEDSEDYDLGDLREDELYSVIALIVIIMMFIFTALIIAIIVLALINRDLKKQMKAFEYQRYQSQYMGNWDDPTMR